MWAGRIVSCARGTALTHHLRVLTVRCGSSVSAFSRTPPLLGPLPTVSHVSVFSTSALHSSRKDYEDAFKNSIRRRIDRGLKKGEESEKRLRASVEEQEKEPVPEGLVAKFKYYFKRYWLVAIVVHSVCCVVWFAAFYALVNSGVDVVKLLSTLHVPEGIIQKVGSISPSAGVLVVAAVLYKIATPLRYATSIITIQFAIPVLRRMGILPTVQQMRLKALQKLNERRRNVKRFKRRPSDSQDS